METFSFTHVCCNMIYIKRKTCVVSKLQPCYGTLSQKENMKTCLTFYSDTCHVLDASTIQYVSNG